jgi:hypothetical protein
MSMTQVGRQNGQPTFYVISRSVPADQGLEGEAVPKVMQARTVAVIGTAQANLA